MEGLFGRIVAVVFHALVGALWLIGRLLEGRAQAAEAAGRAAGGTAPDATSAAGRASR